MFIPKIDNRIVFLIKILVFSFASVFANPLVSYWQQKVDYDMEITLHDSIQQVAGNSIIKYKNNSPDSLKRIYIHLYPNAFQNGSTKYREYLGNAGRISRAKYFKESLKKYSSKIDIHNFSISLPKEGSSWIHKTPILDDYKIDDTILEAKLANKIAPGETVRIDIEWTHHVGEMIERAGIYEGQYNMAQWYPKLAVYDQEGWHADVFHAEGEFYGEFGDFKVVFDIPKIFVIGATGVVIDGDPGWNEVKVDTSIEYNVWLDLYNSNLEEIDENVRLKVIFFAENVHDFAWVASKDFLYEGGMSLDNETKVHVLYDKNRGEDWTEVVLERSINALDWLEKKFGNYPYPQITTTDRIKNGGMEYPMLVMNGRDSESLIVHEYGHIYFYGILANNELDEAWLDEGFTTNQTTRYMMNRYGEHGFETSLYEDYDHFPNKVYPLENDLHTDQWRAIRLMNSGHDENISRPSYLFNNGSAYGRNAYTKPSLMLFELKYILGDSLYDSAIRHYYNKWKLKHVNEKRFVQAIEEYVGKELDWFFDSWLHTTRKVDYKISFLNKTKNKDDSWNIELGIKNIGSRFLPMLVETTFDDQSKERHWWNNHLWRFQDTLRYTSKKKPISVTLDPDVQTMDLDYRNNTTKIKKRFLYDWPGIAYNPRDEIVYWWSPQFYYYHYESDFSPGLKLKRKYGPYEETILRTNYALKSQTFYWFLSGWRKSVHLFPRTKFKFSVYHLPGVKHYGGALEKKWSRVYGTTPSHIYTGGFYIQPEYDSKRAEPLGYDTNGKLAVGYLKWKSGVGSLNFNLNLSTSFLPYSTWSFNKITSEINYKYKKNLASRDKKQSYSIRDFTLHFNHRIIIGKIWSGQKGVPGQEGFNIEGNSANDMFEKDYLVDQFYGQKSLFTHYHLPGEGNIRGFSGQGKTGADVLISTSNEISIIKDFAKRNNLPFNIEIASFMDYGIFWNKPLRSISSLENNYGKRIFADAGIGIRFDTEMLGKNIYVRLDFPILMYSQSDVQINYNTWVFSFQRSL